ncbi:hypothetical protein FPV67DRAFT_1168316 [Lyophyllum atratum]|nr:hypothetical protein FPV67DRAFT_1168316 [Lyophyllum atratum]
MITALLEYRYRKPRCGDKFASMDPFSGSQPQLWLSQSKYDGPIMLVNNDDSSFMFSIVLDGDAQKHFAGIRLVIVYKEGGKLKNMKFVDRFESNKFGIYPSYRKQLTQHRDTIGQAKSESLPQERQTRRLCVVVLELVDHSSHSIHHIRLQHCPQSTFDGFRVAYDRAHSSTSVVSLLESTHTLCTPRRPMMRQVGGSWGQLSAYSIRILPINHHRLSIDFPRDVVRRIAYCATEHQRYGWRAQLWSMGLVCKSWSHVLDLFFFYLPEFSGHNRASAISISRSLEANMARGKLISGFSHYNYTDFTNAEEGTYLQNSRAFMTILSLATSMTDVFFSVTHPSLAADLIEVLSRLRKVKKCSVQGFPNQQGNNIRNHWHILLLTEIQRFIASWPGLQTLELCYWKNSRHIDPVSR